MKRKLLLSVMAVLALAANAYDFEVDGLCYNFTSNNTVELTHKQFNEWQSNSCAYPYSIGDLIIPTAVEYLGKEYSVTAISNYAFMRSNVKSVYIPYTITTIGDYAFGYNSGITNVTIPYSVTKVGRYAFYACYSLESVTICNPSTIFIGGDAFQKCQIDTLNLTGNGASRFNHNSGYVGNIDAIYTVNIGSGITSLSDLGIDATATTINCYAELPPSCGEWTFKCYNAELHVPPVSTVSYFTADYWSNFSNLINDLSDKVTLDKTNASLVQWETLSLTTTAIIGGSKVIWSTSNPNVAIVNEDGVVTAISEGECDIFATLESNIAVYASCHIISSYPVIIALTLNEDEIAFSNVGDTFTLIATTNPENSGPAPTWVSSDETVATVDENGVVTAMGEGECDITVSVIDKIATCHVTVNSTIIISLDQQEATVLPNHIIVLTPSASPVMPDGFTVTSSDPSVAVARLMNGKVQVVGIKEGTTMITVGSTDGKALPATCFVTVYTEIGDVNCDGYVNISDVTDLIDYLLSGNGDSVSATNADCDKDGNVNIADVTTLIDYLLGGIDLNPPVTETFTVNGVTFKMVAVEGDTFTMGASDDDVEAWDDEKPAHQVTLSSYAIGETEVTQALWLAVMGSNPSYFTGDLQRPVEQVSWDDCQTFITKLNAMTGRTFRLPTEAEWEFAARGGKKSRGNKYAGSNDINEVAWYNSNSSSQTHTVAAKAPNELGLYDMSGNVWERCQDLYSSYSSDAKSDTTPHTSTSRMYRGGSWIHYARNCRVSVRDGNYPEFTCSDVGLRLAL